MSSSLTPECIAELATAQAALAGSLRGKVAGFRRGPEELIKLPSGDYNEAAVLRETHFECYHCGSLWRDDGEFGPVRIGLDESSHYVARRPEALPENVGFNIPQWINRRLPWGKMMLDKLNAQRTATELGNWNDLRIWWQKVAARTWDKDITAKAPERLAASLVDDAAAVAGEKVRISATDCQLDLTHLIYQAWSIREGKGPWLLHYEWVKPPAGLDSAQEQREFCKNRVRALDKQFGVLVQNSMKDCAHRPDLVREWAAEDAVYARIRTGKGIGQKWVTYGLLIGDERPSYRWEHPGRKPTWERFKRKETVLVEKLVDGKRIKIPVQHRLWSNPSIKEIAARWRDGDGAPRMEIHQKWLDDSPRDGLWAQLTSERKVPWRGRPGREIWDNEGRPNHAWDGWNMVVVRMDELDYLGGFGAPEADAGE